MIQRRPGMWIVILVLALGWNLAPARAQEAGNRSSAESAMAEQCAEEAQNLLRLRNIVDPAWQASAAMLQAAVRLNPDDPRYLRLLSEAQLQVRNEAGALDTLRQLVAKDPASQTAQIQLIDLYQSSLQTAEARMDHLKNLLGVQAIPEPVRSHVALRLARLYMERSQAEQALNMLSQAVRLNPQNLSALQMRYQMLQSSGSPLERSTVLMAMLRANPAQPAVAATLANETAQVGLVDDSLSWYGVALNVYNRLGQLPPAQTAVDYAAELFISGQSPAAIGWVTQLLQMDPTNVDAWFLRLVIERGNGNKDLYDKAKHDALVALTNRLQMARQAAGHKDAATQPIETPGEASIPDVTAEVKAINEKTAQEIRSAYTMSLIDLAWFEAYFNEQPAQVRKLLDSLKLLLPADNLTLARLEGWAMLLEGKKDEAKVKLSAVSDRDPLGALGLIRLADKNAAGEQSAGAIGRRIFNDNPSGVLGALLWGELNSHGVQVILSQQAVGIKMELEKFPTDWLKIIDSPDGFYVLRAVPQQVSHQFGEPMFAQITLRNISNYPLTVSPDGVIRPDLWIDAQLRGAAQQGVPPVFDRLAQQILLPPGQSMSQIVRVDQGALDQLFASNPSISVQVYATLMTNPTTFRGGVGPGPAGYKVQFGRIFERAGFPLTSEEAKRKLLDRVNNGSGADRIHAIELLASYARFFSSQEGNQFRPLVDEFTAVLRRAGAEPTSASIRAWANYQRLVLLPPAQRAGEIKPLLGEADWLVRLMALLATQGIDQNQQIQLLSGPAQNDADPIVRQYASSMTALLKIAATQPSTTQPANDEMPPSTQSAPTGG